MNKNAQALGKLGGKATVEKYGKDKMKEWGRKGGRPKTKNIDKALESS